MSNTMTGKVAWAISCAAVVLLCIGQAIADNLTFCGVPAAPGQHSVVVVATVCPGGATVTGTATEIQTDTSDRIILSPLTISTPGTVSASNTYNLLGEGTLTSDYAGMLLPAPLFSTGGESLDWSSQATTFNNNPAVASSTVPAALALPVSVSNAHTNNGEYGPDRQGTLTAFVRAALPAGESFFFPGSGESIATAAVPEPNSLALFGAGLVGLFLLAWCKIRRRMFR